MEKSRTASGTAKGIAATLLTLLVIALMLASGCGQNDGELQVRGQVIAVTARSFSELESLIIRDENGREYAFETEGFVGFTPSHVREHQLLGLSLLVTYIERGDRKIAVGLAD